MRLYRTTRGAAVERDGQFHTITADWDVLVNRPDLRGYLEDLCRMTGAVRLQDRIRAPLQSQEVWAAGVTYHRSRSARMEESSGSGSASFYDRVYEAERPELFFKASPWRVQAHDEPVRIRRDAAWSVPEPEIALCINSAGRIVGFTIGNDMSSRDIEGENPLYLSQAKIYDGACSLGPAILVADELSGDTPIELRIMREGRLLFEGRTTFSQMRRSPRELVDFLFRETSFPNGPVLLTGTGIVPPDDVRLELGDEIIIYVPPIGTLANTVA